MLKDLRRYTKFFSISKSAPKKQWAINTYSKKLKNCKINSVMDIRDSIISNNSEIKDQIDDQKVFLLGEGSKISL